MTYKELLDDYIKKSGLSHREISRRSKEKGMSVSQGYISQLVRGDVPPPSEEITKVLAEIVGGDPERLIWYAYVEKAPKEIQPIIKWYIDHWDNYAHTISALFIDPDKAGEKYDEYVDKIYKALQELPPEQKLDFVINTYNKLVLAQPDFFRELGKTQGISDERIEATINTIKEVPLNRIQVFDLLKEEETFDWVHTEKIKGDDYYFYVIAHDDSMIGANINSGSKILCIKMDDDYEIESGKIYLVSLGDSVFIRRVFKQEGQPITLQSENPKYSPIIVNENDEFGILGMVKSVEFDPNQD